MIESEAYVDAMRSLEAQHTAAMVQTPPGPLGQARRDHHHGLLAALRELAGELAARAISAAQHEMRLSADQVDDETDEDGIDQ